MVSVQKLHNRRKSSYCNDLKFQIPCCQMFKNSKEIRKKRELKQHIFCGTSLVTHPVLVNNNSFDTKILIAR